MLNAFSRTELLLGADAMARLQGSKVAVFGVGGVGSYTVEALARAGVGHFVLVDDDLVCLTNLNRQLHATRRTVGRPKVEVMAERIREINPDAQVETHQTFYLPEYAEALVRADYSYLVDAIDTVKAKIDLVVNAHRLGIPVISAMGAGNKLDPTRFEVADLSKTSVCPLARVMRTELRRRGIEHLKVVYSKEPPLTPRETEDLSCSKHCVCPPGTQRHCTVRRQIPGSVSFVPPVMGMILAGEVIKDLIGYCTGESAT